MQELRHILDDEFKKYQFSTILDNQTDDHLSMIIRGGMGQQTILKIDRNRHKALEVEVNVDFNFSSPKNVIRSTRPRNQNQGRGFMGGYRSIWLLFIFAGLIINVLFLFSDALLQFVENLTPGWSPFQRGVSVFILVVLIIIAWFRVPPIIRQQRHAAGRKFDEKVLSIVSGRIKSLQAELTKTTIVRCWNCFEVINPNEVYCPNCGKDQQ